MVWSISKMNTPTLIIVRKIQEWCTVTDILSRYNNIAQMTLLGKNAGEKAIMIIEIDSHQCDEAVTEIAKFLIYIMSNFFS